MAISSHLGPGYLPAPEPPADPSAGDGEIRLSEFTLAHVPEAHQVALRNGNPLCALIARTASGAQVCNHGCGIAGPQAPARHVCPFGMAMHRLPDDAPLGRTRHNRQTHWIGRRFATVADLHAALDRLTAEGIDEATILDHLPANPVVDEESLAEAVLDRSGARIISIDLESRREAARTAAALPASAAEPVSLRQTLAFGESAKPLAGGISPIAAMIEYLSQIADILGGAEQPTKICERFLKAASAALPVEQSTIFLRRRVKASADAPAHLGDELIATASLGQPDSASESRRKPSLSSHELGPIVLSEGRPMIERDGRVELFNPHDDEGCAGAAIGIPLAAFGGAPLGVWLGRFPAGSAQGPWCEDPVRMMQLLGELLSIRLQKVMAAPPSKSETAPQAQSSPAPAQAPAPAPIAQIASPAPIWNRDALIAALAPEAARAARADSMLTLLQIRIEIANQGQGLPVAALAKAMRTLLRPYDVLALGDDASGQNWRLIASHPAGAEIESIPVRLQTLIEDVLDANGGLEERGIKVAIGYASLGADAADARELALRADLAAQQALLLADPSANARYSESANAPQAGPHSAPQATPRSARKAATG